MDSDSNVISTRFSKSVIRSRRAMTYEEAQLKIDDVNQKDVLAESLRNLNDFAKKMKKRRMDKGYDKVLLSLSLSRTCSLMCIYLQRFDLGFTRYLFARR